MTKIFMPIEKIEDLSILSIDLDELTLGMAFGRVPFYLLFDTVSKEKELIKNENHHFNGKINPWDKAREWKTDVVIAPHLGSSPYRGLAKSNIRVYVAEGSLSNAVDRYLNNELDEMEEPEKGTSCSGKKHTHNH